MPVDIAGRDLAPVLHDHGGGKGLAARGGAHVQHPGSRLHAGGQHRRPRGGVLDLEPSLLKGGHGLQTASAGEQPALRHPGMRLDLRPGIPQALLQLRRRTPHRVALDGGGDGLVVQAEVLFRFLLPQQLHEPPDQPLRVAVAQGQILDTVSRRYLRQGVLLPAQPPEDGVHHARGPLVLLSLYQLHALVHGGAVRHPVHEQYLIRAQTQHVPDEGL